MKTLLSVLALTFISTAAMAANIECKLDTLLADKGGFLMPTSEEISLTSEIQSDVGDIDFRSCKSIRKNGYNISLCAGEMDFIGGYGVQLYIAQLNVEEYPTVAQAFLATSKKGDELLSINEYRPVIGSVSNKLRGADIEVPDTLGNDSHQLDKAVKAGIKKGVLTPNEPVVISINNCKLLK